MNFTLLKWQVTSVVQKAAAEPSLVAFKSENRISHLHVYFSRLNLA